MLKRAMPLLLVLPLVACGGDSGGPGPSPTPTPTPSTFTLSGVVTNASNGQGVGGATVTVLDGPARNRSATTDGAGNYSIANISESGFTARAQAQYYTERSEGITLTGDRIQNFGLQPIALFTRAGSGNAVFDMPPHVTRVRIFGRWNNRGTSNFLVIIEGWPVVDAVLRDGNPYEGTHLTTGGETQIVNSENITQWSFTEVRE